mmetsp:Transcript_59679/g.194732  ORF Transcript_59679/g.194732 Transcript_59679/m.194732 type:complete len:259 (+) Transcript_59679:74-850(+)
MGMADLRVMSRRTCVVQEATPVHRQRAVAGASSTAATRSGKAAAETAEVAPAVVAASGEAAGAEALAAAATVAEAAMAAPAAAAARSGAGRSGRLAAAPRLEVGRVEGAMCGLSKVGRQTSPLLLGLLPWLPQLPLPLLLEILVLSRARGGGRRGRRLAGPPQRPPPPRPCPVPFPQVAAPLAVAAPAAVLGEAAVATLARPRPQRAAAAARAIHGRAARASQLVAPSEHGFKTSPRSAGRPGRRATSASRNLLVEVV